MKANYFHILSSLLGTLLGCLFFCKKYAGNEVRFNSDNLSNYELVGGEFIGQRVPKESPDKSASYKKRCSGSVDK
jgi:hypothetical protein